MSTSTPRAPNRHASRPYPSLASTAALHHHMRALRSLVSLAADPRGAGLEVDVKRIARSGELRIGVWTAPPVHEPTLLADRAAVEWELIPLGARWTQIDRAAGEARIVHWLRTNLAYPKSAAQMDAETAAGFAAQLFALVGSGAPLTVLANDPWDLEEAGSSKSVSIGGFIFDGALAVVAAGEPARVGLLWIGVED